MLVMNLLEKLQRLKIVDGLLVIGFLLVIVGIGVNLKDQFDNDDKVVIESQNISPTGVVQVKNRVVVDVEGEVMKAGIYELDSESRVEDALILAGGLGANADRDWVEKNLNKAERLVDGQKILIPKKGEVLSSSSYKVESSSKVVRINSATAEELDTLNGIGPAMAQRIIEYRIQNGGFKSVEEIKLVSGIGDKLFEKIKNEVAL